ncbi:MAG: helix-turn-helix domain-containing protein [Micropruina sp.]
MYGKREEPKLIKGRLAVGPKNERPLIGARLRAGRLRLGFTLEQIASVTGLNKGFISRIERDETSPSLSSLVGLCGALSMSVGTLFDAPALELVRREDAPVMDLTGESVDERLITPRGQGRVQIIRSRIEPGGTGGAELYTLNCEVRVAHVISGRLLLRFNNESIALGRGDTLTFGGREPHSWDNPQADRSTDVMWVNSPASWSAAV